MFNNKIGILMTLTTLGIAMTTGVGYAAEQGIVTADSLNIRSGPSTSYSIKAKVTKGTVVNIGTKNSNGWYEVTLDNGITGWASGSYIDVIQVGSSKKGEITEATYLRKEAKWTTDKLALLKKGVKVDIISTDVNWTKVKYNNEIGYIANQCINIDSFQNENQENTNSNNTNVKGKITVSTYLREEAKWTTDKLELLNPGIEVDIVSTSANWTKVKYKNQVGYIANDYIEIVDKDSEDIVDSVVPEESDKYGKIISGDTYLRKEAKWAADKMVLLKKNTEVKILSCDSNWTKVKYKDQIGYVSNDYIKENVEDELKDGQGKILEATYLRDVDSWSANKITLLEKGIKVDVVSRGLNWTKVKYKGQIGYVGNAYIEISGDVDLDRDAKVEKVINLAKAQIGKPYKYGEEGPNSFDCSGLVYYVYKNGVGITLPRVSKDQAKVGSSVSYSEMKPGDIIGFDFNKDGVVTHTGIYLGGGEFIHALKPGTVVQKTSISSNYWRNAISSIRRVL